MVTLRISQKDALRLSTALDNLSEMLDIKAESIPGTNDDAKREIGGMFLSKFRPPMTRTRAEDAAFSRDIAAALRVAVRVEQK